MNNLPEIESIELIERKDDQIKVKINLGYPDWRYPCSYTIGSVNDSGYGLSNYTGSWNGCGDLDGTGSGLPVSALKIFSKYSIKGNIPVRITVQTDYGSILMNTGFVLGSNTIIYDKPYGVTGLIVTIESSEPDLQQPGFFEGTWVEHSIHYIIENTCIEYALYDAYDNLIQDFQIIADAPASLPISGEYTLNCGTPGLFGWDVNNGRVASFSNTMGEEDLNNVNYNKIFQNITKWLTKNKNNPSILLLSDGLTSKASSWNQSRLQALNDMGATTTLSEKEWFNYDGSDIENYDLIILGGGCNWASGTDMLISAQNAIVDFVNNGGSLLTSEWIYWRVSVSNTMSIIKNILPGTSNAGQWTTVDNLIFKLETYDPIVGLNIPDTFEWSPSSADGVYSFISIKPGVTNFYSVLNTKIKCDEICNIAFRLVCCDHDIPSQPPSPVLFNKNSWNSSIHIDPAIKLLIDEAADAWKEIIKFDDDVVKSIKETIPLWNGIAINLYEKADYGPGPIAACGVESAINLGNNKYNALSFNLYINSYYWDNPQNVNFSWSQVLIHELGHALGIGTLWTELEYIWLNGNTYTSTQNAYNTINNITRFRIPLESTGGGGTASAHWEDNDRSNDGQLYPGIIDIMQGTINNYPIGPVTIGFLKDLGYTNTSTLSGNNIMTNSNNVGLTPAPLIANTDQNLLQTHTEPRHQPDSPRCGCGCHEHFPVIQPKITLEYNPITQKTKKV